MALALASIEVAFGLDGRIWRIYLLDAAIELAFRSCHDHRVTAERVSRAGSRALAMGRGPRFRIGSSDGNLCSIGQSPGDWLF